MAIDVTVMVFWTGSCFLESTYSKYTIQFLKLLGGCSSYGKGGGSLFWPQINAQEVWHMSFVPTCIPWLKCWNEQKAWHRTQLFLVFNGHQNIHNTIGFPEKHDNKKYYECEPKLPKVLCQNNFTFVNSTYISLMSRSRSFYFIVWRLTITGVQSDHGLIISIWKSGPTK